MEKKSEKKTNKRERLVKELEDSEVALGTANTRHRKDKEALKSTGNSLDLGSSINLSIDEDGDYYITHDGELYFSPTMAVALAKRILELEE